MKLMVIMETEEEKAAVREMWDAVQSGKEGVQFGGLLDYITDGRNVKTLASKNQVIAYFMSGGEGNAVWEVYNFDAKRHYQVTHDLAGLANTEDGDFPFFN